MMSLTLSSQNTKTQDSITISKKALKSMAKESRVCDSLRIAYDSQLKTLNVLVESNFDYFKLMQAAELKRDQLQIELEESVEALRKKKNNWVLPTSLGVIGGVVIGAFISN